MTTTTTTTTQQPNKNKVSSSLLFDLDVHIVQRYTGEARLQRLLWVAMHTHDDQKHNNNNNLLKLEAYKLAEQYCKENGNIIKYKELHHRVPDIVLLDNNWIIEKEQQNRHVRDVLLGRLQTAQSHLNKDAVRTAFTNLSTYYVNIGEMGDAFHSITRAKDYCLTRQQTATNSLHILQVALFEKNYSAVRDYVPRLQHTMNMLSSSSSNTTATGSTGTTSSTDNTGTSGAAASSGGSAPSSSTTMMNNNNIQNQLLVFSGLERLAWGDYKSASTKFRQVVMNHHNIMSSAEKPMTNTNTTEEQQVMDNNNVLHPDDISVYAGLLTLAFENDRSVCIDLAEHPDALELCPVLRDAILLFHKRAQYQECYELLETNIFPLLQYDLYLQQQTTSGIIGSSSTGGDNSTTHLAIIQQAIRYKAIGQYWKPYSNCPLIQMEHALGPGICCRSSSSSPNNSNLRDTIVHLLKSRRRHGEARHVLPMDTRYDIRGDTLVRMTTTTSVNNNSNHRDDADQDRYDATHQKLQATSTRVLNDTYAMLVRVACLDHDLVVTDPTSGRSSRGRGGGRDYRPSSHNNNGDPEECDDIMMQEQQQIMHMMDVDNNNAMNPEDLY